MDSGIVCLNPSTIIEVDVCLNSSERDTELCIASVATACQRMSRYESRMVLLSKKLSNGSESRQRARECNTNSKHSISLTIDVEGRGNMQPVSVSSYKLFSMRFLEVLFAV